MLLSSRIASSKKIPNLLLECKCHTLCETKNGQNRYPFTKKGKNPYPLGSTHSSEPPPPPGKIIAFFRIKFQLN